jgi:Flp pilus assembly protein CpaB
MQSKSLILLVVALGCGVVASIGITRVMASRSTAPAAQEMETQPVFVVKEDIPLGNALTAEKLKLEQWPKGKVPEGVLGNLEDIEGRRPKAKLFAGEPVLEVKLLSKGESAGGAAPQIPVGYRSVPVKVDEVSGGAAMILPGDRVDVLVYAKANCKEGIRTTMTKTILQNIRVFAVDSQWTLEADESGKSIRAKTISLLLTPEQTERVMLAHELGKLRLALRSPNDSEDAELSDKGHQVAQIFGDSETADIEKDSVLGSLLASQPEVPVTVEPIMSERPSHTVRVINGSEVQEVVMQSQVDAPSPTAPSGSSPKSGSPTSFLWKIISNPTSMMGGNGDSTAKLDPGQADPAAMSAETPNLDLDPGPPESDDEQVEVMDD